MKSIITKNLSYRYDDGIEALKDVSIEVMQGQKVALIGNNGSGKSTLLLNLMGLLDGDGYIQIAGINRTKTTINSIRNKIGYLSGKIEYNFIMPDLINDVMLSMPSEYDLNEKKNRAVRWLEKFNLLSYREKNPLELSSGEMKRAAIAGIMAKEPEILILDEPMNNLDRRNSFELLEILQSIKSTMLIATHRSLIVDELATHVAVMNDGRLTGYYTKKDAVKMKEIRDLLL